MNKFANTTNNNNLHILSTKIKTSIRHRLKPYSIINNIMFKLRKRSWILIAFIMILTPCVILLFFMGPELSTEQLLSQRLAECHIRLQYLESMYHARQEDVAILTKYLGQHLNNQALLSSTAATFAAATSPNSSKSIILNASNHGAGHLLASLSAEAKVLLKNATHSHSNFHNINSAYDANIRLPNAYYFLPHLLEDSNSLHPYYLQSKGRSNVSIVLGIPTVRREKQSYLLGTLRNLIERMSDEEQNDTLIVVFIGENESEAAQSIAKEIESSFEPFIENGLIDIIAPAASYYPNFDKLRITLGDSLERVKWRSKQNLDFAYIMAYAQTKGE